MSRNEKILGIILATIKANNGKASWRQICSLLATPSLCTWRRRHSIRTLPSTTNVPQLMKPIGSSGFLDKVRGLAVVKAVNFAELVTTKE